jgi:alkanesulfonate monooxygenase
VRTLHRNPDRFAQVLLIVTTCSNEAAVSEPTFHWFLPTAGDGREVGAVIAVQGRSAQSINRRPTLDYLGQIAKAAEASGFTAVLTPTGSGCEDAWITCAALIPETRSLNFLVAFRPGFILPTLAAQQATTFQRLSGGRLRLNIVTGGDPVEQKRYGDFLDHDQRYARTDEFLSVFRQALTAGPYDHEGEHFHVEGGGSVLRHPAAPIYFGGASPAGEAVAAKQADVYLTWGETPAAVGERVERMREKASVHGRELSFGIRLHVISRDTPEEAWAEADRLLDAMDPSTIRAAQERFARMDSVGQQRMAALHGGAADGSGLGESAHHGLEVAPNLWAGIGLVREGAATALVGSHEQVAERLDEYASLGFDEFILSGYPHLEEAFRVGEQVVPLVTGTPAPVASARKDLAAGATAG